MMDNLQKDFSKGLEELGINLSTTQFQQFDRYYEILRERGKVMNLTTITELKDVREKHFLDSLAITKLINMTENLQIIDVGTGAGFPGIPIKIAFPNTTIVLLDSLNKRINFLNEVIEELGLKGIQAIHGRAEDIARNEEYREKFDLCVSRAVASLSTLTELCLPFARVGGSFVSYKAGNPEEEIEHGKNALTQLGGSITDVFSFSIPNTEIRRTLINISKVKETPTKYPRKAGLPGKAPLS